MAGGKSIEIKPGQLMTGLSADSAGISNYIAKREWRRVLDRDVRAEGYDGFRPNPTMDRGIQSVPSSGGKTTYNNAAVYFNNVCQVGYTATLVGIFTLPAWIQLQTDRNRFVVPAGIFSGPSQAEADQNAQAALNDFIQTNMSNGNIVCVQNVPPTSFVILKDDEITNVLNRFCENIQTISGKTYFMPWGTPTGGIFSSSDGLTWSRILTPSGSNVVYDIAFGAGIYVAPGSSIGGNGIVYTSPDGITWTQRTAVAGFSNFWTVAFGSGVFVIAGDNNTVAWSADGITWTNVGGIGTGGNNIYRVRFLNGKFYAVNPFTGKMFSSADGKVWALSHTFTSPSDIAYGNGIYVVCENAGNTYTSPDAVTWTQHVFSGSPHLLGLAFGNGLFAIVTNARKILTSTDGFTWVDSGRTATNVLAAITYAGSGKFIAAEG